MDDQGDLKRVWVEMELPEGGHMECIFNDSPNFKRNIELKIRIKFEYYHQGTFQNSIFGHIHSMNTLRENLNELAFCCENQSRSQLSCNFCIHTQEEFLDIIQLHYFNIHPISFLENDSLNFDTGLFGDFLLNDIIFDLDKELHVLDSLIQIINPEVNLKVFSIDYEENCEDFSVVLDAFNLIGPEEIGIIIFIFRKSFQDGIFGWKMISYDVDFSPLPYGLNNESSGRSFDTNDTCYYFNSSNYFIFKNQCDKEETPKGIILNFKELNFDLEFIFADPIITPRTLVSLENTRNSNGNFLKFGTTDEPLLNKVYNLSKDDIALRLSQVIAKNGENLELGAFDYHGVFLGPILSLYKGSDGLLAPFDYSTKHWLLDRQNYLFLTSVSDLIVGHNFRNYGNFLWGAATYIMGVPEIVAIAGAHVYALKNEGEFDSEDDIFSIKLGRQYAREVGFRTIYGGRKNIFKR